MHGLGGTGESNEEITWSVSKDFSGLNNDDMVELKAFDAHSAKKTHALLKSGVSLNIGFPQGSTFLSNHDSYAAHPHSHLIVQPGTHLGNGLLDCRPQGINIRGGKGGPLDARHAIGLVHLAHGNQLVQQGSPCFLHNRSR